MANSKNQSVQHDIGGKTATITLISTLVTLLLLFGQALGKGRQTEVPQRLVKEVTELTEKDALKLTVTKAELVESKPKGVVDPAEHWAVKLTVAGSKDVTEVLSHIDDDESNPERMQKFKPDSYPAEWHLATVASPGELEKAKTGSLKNKPITLARLIECLDPADLKDDLSEHNSKCIIYAMRMLRFVSGNCECKACKTHKLDEPKGEQKKIVLTAEGKKLFDKTTFTDKESQHRVLHDVLKTFSDAKIVQAA